MNKLLFAFLILSGCSTPLQLLKTGDGYYRLPEKAYVLKSLAKHTDAIITSPGTIYTCCVCYGRSSDFLKFFSNGIVLQGETYRYESGRSDTIYAAGYFLLSGNQIKIELPAGSTTFFKTSWSSLVYSGTLVNDEIRISKAQWGGKGRNDSHMLKIKRPGIDSCDYKRMQSLKLLKIPQE